MSDFVDGLREMADFLDMHPHLLDRLNFASADAHVFARDESDFSDLLLDLGKGEKRASEGYLSVRRRFGPHALVLSLARSLACERVQTGTETVEETVGLDEVPCDAEVLGEVRQVKIKRTVPTFEWKCPESFLAGGG